MCCCSICDCCCCCVVSLSLASLSQKPHNRLAMTVDSHTNTDTHARVYPLINTHALISACLHLHWGTTENEAYEMLFIHITNEKTEEITSYTFCCCSSCCCCDSTLVCYASSGSLHLVCVDLVLHGTRNTRMEHWHNTAYTSYSRWWLTQNHF